MKTLFQVVWFLMLVIADDLRSGDSSFAES